MPAARRRSLRAGLRSALLSAALLAAAVTVGIETHAPAAGRTTYTHGMDVSWPQCAGAATGHMPGWSPSYLILGLTDGAGDTANPCLAAQFAWAKERQVPVGAYLVPSFPTPRELAAAGQGLYGDCPHDSAPRTCRLHNAGVAMAADAIAVMHQAGVPAPMVWLDVEFRSGAARWRHHPANLAVIKGVVRGMHHAGVRFGVYSTSLMWHDIVGNYRLNVPNWLPAGSGRPHDAEQRCETSATGGPTWIAQYTRSLDNDITCPVMDVVPGHPGRLWRWRWRHEQLRDTGRVVAVAQRQLHVHASGIYDAATALAAVRYERRKGLPITGKVEPPEWRSWGAFKLHGGHAFWLSRVARG